MYFTLKIGWVYVTIIIRGEGYFPTLSFFPDSPSFTNGILEWNPRTLRLSIVSSMHLGILSKTRVRYWNIYAVGVRYNTLDKQRPGLEI